jgi:hypothetical protein
VESLLPLVQLKHEEEFTWGQNSERLGGKGRSGVYIDLSIRLEFACALIIKSSTSPCCMGLSF